MRSKCKKATENYAKMVEITVEVQDAQNQTGLEIILLLKELQ